MVIEFEDGRGVSQRGWEVGEGQLLPPPPPPTLPLKARYDCVAKIVSLNYLSNMGATVIAIEFGLKYGILEIRDGGQSVLLQL